LSFFEKLNIEGKVRVGTEGLNSIISSTLANVVEFEDHFMLAFT